MSRFRDPFGRTFFEQPTPDGAIALEVAPGQEICDFCMAPTPAWFYPCGPVQLAGNPNMTDTDDEWAACERCHDLIESGADINAIVGQMVEWQREAALTEEFTMPDHYVQRAVTRKNVQGFLDARLGPAQRLRGERS